MVSWREREIPGRESDENASSWGKPGRSGEVRVNGNRGAKNQILRWVVEVQRASGVRSKPTPIGSIIGGL
jgi:hypothetical protein